MDINGAIAKLDKLITKKGLTYVLYTCGGAQLIFLGYTTRRTEDVDLIQDKIDEPLRLASLEVAKKLKIQDDWLNNKVSSLSQRLGKGWKRKAVVLFEGKAITLMGSIDRILSVPNFTPRLIEKGRIMRTFFS